MIVNDTFVTPNYVGKRLTSLRDWILLLHLNENMVPGPVSSRFSSKRKDTQEDAEKSRIFPVSSATFLSEFTVNTLARNKWLRIYQSHG